MIAHDLALSKESAMSGTGAVVTLSPRDYDAVLFDLDGVLTKTASVHAAAWKKLFDAFLERRASDTGEPFIPFDIDVDYRRYVDGKPRYDGVAAFLEARGIGLPLGTPEDGPDARSVHALGKRKDGYFRQHLEQHGIEPYEASIALVRTLRAQEIRTAVVSSSNNCAAVLEAAGISHLFDARVDGKDITRLGLEGKPAPDAFLEGARRVNAEPSRAVVVEDAIAGVEAGRAGRFGCVIGVDRGGQSQALREAGADVVVTSLAQVQLAAEPPSAWSLVYENFDPAREGMHEALCALGNGYFETRGAAAWARADDIHYPGTYLAGGYNRLRTDIAGRMVENEDLVNFPNWLALAFRIADEDWFDERAVKILSYRQELDLRRGMLLRTVGFEDGKGRRSTLRERRLVSMADMHLGALELTLSAENWSAPVTVRSAIDGRIVNAGAKLYRKFNNEHLVPLAGEAVGEDGVYLLVRTCQSNVHVAQAARTRVFVKGELRETSRRIIDEPGYIGQELCVELAQGETLVLEKMASFHTSRDHAISECGLAARKAIARVRSFEAVMAEHVLAWKHLWRRFDVHMQPAGPGFELNVPMLLRLNMFHLLQAVSPNSIGLDIGVPARGWTGEAYQGHIFWDELFIFPFLNYRMPEITRSLLMYRYRRLGEARAAARSAGFQGAMFPWQSGSDGQEETQELNLNHRSQRWVPDNSYLQRHVGSAIAYNVWQYFQVTNDVEFMQFYGAELILDIARFWSSIARFNDERGRYEIRGVMGPDEFHESYPDSPAPGLDNNAYTNIMAVWVLRRALEVLDAAPRHTPRRPHDAASIVGRRDRALGRHQPQNVRAVSWRRDHQPVRGLRKARRAELGGLPDALWQHPAPGPHTRSGERQREPLQADEAGRRADAVLSVFRRGARRIVQASGLSLRTRDHSAERCLLRRPLLARIHAVTCGACVGIGALGSAALDEILRRGAAKRCERHSAGHHCRGRASRRNGGNGRSGAAGIDGYRGNGGCPAAQSTIAGGDEAPRHAHPLSRALARSAAHARHANGARTRTRGRANPSGIERRGI